MLGFKVTSLWFLLEFAHASLFKIILGDAIANWLTDIIKEKWAEGLCVCVCEREREREMLLEAKRVKRMDGRKTNKRVRYKGEWTFLIPARQIYAIVPLNVKAFHWIVPQDY